MRKSISLFFIMAIVLFLPLMAQTGNAFNCIVALQDLIPCQGYLVFGGEVPSVECCNGVKDLAKIANKSKIDRRELCKCLKAAAQKFPINQAKAQVLPKLCHVNLNVTISPNVDCNKV